MRATTQAFTRAAMQAATPRLAISKPPGLNREKAVLHLQVVTQKRAATRALARAQSRMRTRLPSKSSQIIASLNVVRRFPFQCTTSSQVHTSVLVTVGADGSASVVMTFCLREMYPSLSANDCLITDIGLHMMSTAKQQRCVISLFTA